MGYFQVRYDSRVVNYNPRGFIRLATGLARTPNNMAMGGVGRAVASETRGRSFESGHWQNLHRTIVYCQLSN